MIKESNNQEEHLRKELLEKIKKGEFKGLVHAQ
jgi:hypothetical protein